MPEGGHACLLGQDRQTLRNAATALLGGVLTDPSAKQLLAALGYQQPQTGNVPSPVQHHRARLLEVASQLVRVFRLSAPDAPGLVTLGAEIDPKQYALWWPAPNASASGTGLNLQAAFESCVGEAAEFLSSFETPTDADMLVPDAACACPAWAASLAQLPGVRHGGCIDWISATQLADQRPVLVPADLCLRRDPSRQALRAPAPLSLGCAAGPTFEAAMLHALLELIERDAVANWWRGGRPARMISLDESDLQSSFAFVQILRRARGRRQSWLLDISTDLRIPCVAALSINPDGRGFACGTAAGPTLRTAGEAALREMCQMEVGYTVAIAKRQERGEAALSATDRGHIRRFEAFDVARSIVASPAPADSLVDQPPIGLTDMIMHLAERDIWPAVLDLTRNFIGIPVARVVCPELEMEPATIIGPRLRRQMAATGRFAAASQGIPLM